MTKHDSLTSSMAACFAQQRRSSIAKTSLALITKTVIACFTLLAIFTLPSCEQASSPALESRTKPAQERSKPASRIVTIAPNSAEIISSLGGADRIVGVSKFCQYPECLADKPKVGGLFDPNLELITALRPDLVVLRGRSVEVEELCRQQDIALYLDPTETLADIEECVEALASRIGAVDKGAEEVTNFRTQLELVTSRVADRDRPRVFVTVSRSPGELSDILTTGKGTFLHEVIELSGGRNVFGHLDVPYPQVSIEAIISARPDVIIELMPEQPSSKEVTDRVRREWSDITAIPAARDFRVYIIHEDNALTPSPRYVEILRRIATILHPDS